MTNEELGKKLGHVIAKAFADNAFKQKLLSNTIAVLKEEGVELPVGLELRVVQNTDNLLFIGLPIDSPQELSDKKLDKVDGGTTSRPWIEPPHNLS